MWRVATKYAGDRQGTTVAGIAARVQQAIATAIIVRKTSGP